MRPLAGLTWAGSAYIFGVTAAGVGIVFLGWAVHPLAISDLPLLVYLGVLTQIAAAMPIQWRHGLQTVDGLPLVAAALYAPGAGVAIIAWLFLFDRRLPGRDVALWRLIFTRAKAALEFGVPSLLMTYVHLHGPVDTPIKTIVYALGPVAIGFPLVARGFAFLEGTSFWTVLRENVGLATVRSSLIVGFGGGILYLVLNQPAGLIMGVGLVGLLLAVRANVADAQTQAIERVQTLRLAARALDARDPYTESHSERVADLSAQIAGRLGLGSFEVERIRTGGLLHDLGKLGIRDEILNKAGPLTPDEWDRMKQHPDLGADMIAEHSALVHLSPVVRHHHERFDGAGYPAGIAGDEIPIGARIIAVADAYDTITGPRVYRRESLSPRAAVDNITAGAGSKYDPAVVDALRVIHVMPPVATPRALPGGQESTSGIQLLQRRPRFALLTLGMAISSLGDPLTTVATLVAIYAQTRSAVLVGGVYVIKAAATILMSTVVGGLSDRFRRGSLIVGLDLSRAVTLLATPILLAISVNWIFAVVAVLAIAEAVAQPAREAAMPELVNASEIAPANAVIGAATNTATIVAYPLAAGILLVGSGVNALFLIDAVTFGVAALLMLPIGELGGRVVTRSVAGGLIQAWSVVTARRHLIIAGSGALFISMTLPSIILLAYGLSSSGPTAYTLLEAVVACGIVVGHVLLIVWRRQLYRSPITVGLSLMGLLSLVVSVSPLLWLTALVLFVASIGNAFYTVSNRSALQEAGTSDNRGLLMSARFGVVQSAAIAGFAIGGFLGEHLGARATFAVVGFGLCALAVGTAISSIGRPQKLVHRVATHIE
jgi:putative nucleotidyltransferase with HDIG domain